MTSDQSKVAQIGRGGMGPCFRVYAPIVIRSWMRTTENAGFGPVGALLRPPPWLPHGEDTASHNIFSVGVKKLEHLTINSVMRSFILFSWPLSGESAIYNLRPLFSLTQFVQYSRLPCFCDMA